MRLFSHLGHLLEPYSRTGQLVRRLARSSQARHDQNAAFAALPVIANGDEHLRLPAAEGQHHGVIPRLHPSACITAGDTAIRIQLDPLGRHLLCQLGLEALMDDDFVFSGNQFTGNCLYRRGNSIALDGRTVFIQLGADCVCRCHAG